MFCAFSMAPIRCIKRSASYPKSLIQSTSKRNSFASIATELYSLETVDFLTLIVPLISLYVYKSILYISLFQIYPFSLPLFIECFILKMGNPNKGLPISSVHYAIFPALKHTLFNTASPLRGYGHPPSKDGAFRLLPPYARRKSAYHRIQSPSWVWAADW